MNCAECRENLVACVEGLLEREELLQCQAHLEACADCRAEYAAIGHLQQQLVARGQAAAEVSLVEPVMRRVRREQTQPERDTIMTRLFTRWGFGLSAAAGAAAIILLTLLLSPKGQATAAEVMTRGAKAVAKLRSIHMRCQLRIFSADNFGFIKPEADFVNVELWKEFGGYGKWRIEKPGRVAVMDGQSTLMHIKPGNVGVKVPQPAREAFDTAWLHRIADLSDTITDELNNAVARGWGLRLAEERAADGRTKSVVTVETRSSLPDNDYLKNKFMDDSDTRRVYRFDAQTELLEAVQVYLVGKAGEVLIFEVNQIDYNQSIDPSVFQLQLPANVNWYQEPQNQPGDEKYAALTPEQAARAFFEACGREDWIEVGKFWTTPLNDPMNNYLGGLKLVSVGESFTSAAYPGRYVPYEIQFKTGGAKKFNLALKKDGKTGRWFVDGGI